MRRSARTMGLLLICLLSMTTVGAMARGPASSVVASVHPVSLIVLELGGERVSVRTLVPPGGSPHTFEPLPSDLAKLQAARYFIRVGGGIDGWSEKLLGAAPPSLETLTLLTLPGLRPLRGKGADGVHLEEEKPSESDPHFWLDPIRVRDAVVPLLKEKLIRADPAGRLYYEARAADFERRLTALDAAIRLKLRRSKSRKYVAFHNAWRYFAERYGLEEVAVVQEFAGEEPTPREVANLVRSARDAGIAKILVEPQLSSRIARTIATEFGAGTVVVDPLGNPGDPARSRYEELMLFNTRAFVEALEGKGGRTTPHEKR